MELIINPEYDKLVPNLSKLDYKNLYNSIKENGLWIPILCNPEGKILDGHHRYDICQELGIKTKHAIRIFDNKLLEKKFVIECNLHRRHLTDPQKFLLGEQLEPIEKELSKLEQGKRTDLTLVPNETNVSANDNKTTAKVAKAVGLSRTTYERMRDIKKNIPEVWEDVLSGKTSVAHAHTKLNTEQRHSKMSELPTEKFNVILADPPWKYDVFLRGTPERHYDVMELEDIGKLDIPAADDCILFLWVTSPKITDAIDLLNLWNFEYKTQFVWIKDKIGTGYYCRGQHEILFIAKKGNPPVPKEKDRFSSVIYADRTQHSKKPEIVYEIIERMYPAAKYLELFARNNREGWTSWGNEI